MTPDRAASIVAPGGTMSAFERACADDPPRGPRRVGGDGSDWALAAPSRGAAPGITPVDVAHGCGDTFTVSAAKEGVRA
jgi:hypothetical protein